MDRPLQARSCSLEKAVVLRPLRGPCPGGGWLARRRALRGVLVGRRGVSFLVISGLHSRWLSAGFMVGVGAAGGGVGGRSGSIAGG